MKRFNFYRLKYPCWLIAVIILQAFGSCSIRRDAPVVLIGKSGNIELIAITDTADSVTRFAAGELQYYIEKMTGVRLPIGNETKKRSIKFGLSRDTAIKWDGYRIRTTEDCLSVTAHETRGLLYAVYDLLEQWGCSFVYPGKKEQIVPRIQLIRWKTADTTINPVLEHRGIAPYGLDAKGLEDGRDFIDWMAKNRFNYILVSEDRPSDSDGPAHGSVWKEVQKELLPELQRRGFIIEMSEHCTPVFFPRSLFSKHPDWFALNGGKRRLGPPPYSGQICYSNRDAIAYYGDTLARYAAAHPEFKTIGTWPLDGGDYCECINCKSPQTVFNAILKVAEKVNKVRPDMIVEHLAYKEQTWTPPPVDKIPANISVLWCRDAGESDDLVQQWKQKIDPAAGIYQFEYYLGDNYRSRSNIWLRPEYAAQLVKQARSAGYRGVITLTLPMQTWWRACFNNRFYARASWDTRYSFEEDFNKYCRDYYGTLAENARDIFLSLFTHLQPEPYNRESDALAGNWPSVEKHTPEVLRLIDAALSKSTDENIRERFRRIKSYVQFHELYTKAYHSRKKSDLEKLVQFSRDRPEHAMVLIYPGYIKWRNEEYF